MNLFLKNNKLEVENAQLQYFIDAANRGLKIIAYKAVK